MMSLSVICASIPSLGRLIVELQPNINAFAITEQHGISRNDRYILSTFTGRVPRDYAWNNRLGHHTSVLGSRLMPNEDDAESRRGLREDSITRTLDFKAESLSRL